MSKACNCLEWNFIEQVGILNGFNIQFVELLYSTSNPCPFRSSSMAGCSNLSSSLEACVKAVRYLYSSFGVVKSPQMLHLRADYDMHKIRISQSTPMVSHLMFADDNLLFCKLISSRINLQLPKDI